MLIKTQPSQSLHKSVIHHTYTSLSKPVAENKNAKAGDSFKFQGNIPSTAEKDFKKIEHEFLQLLADPNVSSDTRKKALQKYEFAKKKAGKAEAIRSTVTWLVSGAGATAAAISIIDPTTASKIGALAGFVGAPIATLFANSMRKDEQTNNNFWEDLIHTMFVENRPRFLTEDERFEAVMSGPAYLPWA
jgi:hypothetical protein